MADYFVYILTNKKRGTLYTGVTNNLVRRVQEHKLGCVEGFTSKYKLKWLVYHETTNSVMSAIEREKALKRWRRSWKIELIEKYNPGWEDLSLNI